MLTKTILKLQHRHNKDNDTRMCHHLRVDARIHYAILKQHTPTNPNTPAPKLHKQAETSQHQETTTGTKHRVFSQNPIVCNKPPPLTRMGIHPAGPSDQPGHTRLFDVSPMSTRRRTSASDPGPQQPEQGPVRVL